jgi:deoxycitidine kinase/deoxyguanosine kinase
MSDKRMTHIIISLDGNIGAGKSTLLQEIRNKLHDVVIIDEPVAQWTSLKNGKGKSLLELFYEDKNRWSYTFQNCALLTRLKNIQKAVENIDTTVSGPQVIITERSVLTDKHVFAEMLYDAGNMDPLEWELYESWFNIFGTKYPVRAIIYISTSSVTSKGRINIRNRMGEESIDLEYLDALDKQHKKWVKNTNIPVLTLSTEADIPVEENIERIRLFVDTLRNISS